MKDWIIYDRQRACVRCPHPGASLTKPESINAANPSDCTKFEIGNVDRTFTIYSLNLVNLKTSANKKADMSLRHKQREDPTFNALHPSLSP